MDEWREIRLWYTAALTIPGLFEFKRGRLLEVLTQHRVDHFMVLAEPSYLLVRVSVPEDVINAIVASLQQTLAPLFGRITVEGWTPTDDARRRILDVRPKIQGLPPGNTGWVVKGKDGGPPWSASVSELESMVDAFAIFMTRVVGHFTRAYLREMPSRVEDRWLMSVLLHLMLNSVSFGQDDEWEIRKFPFL
jgi:hypothetical protein